MELKKVLNGMIFIMILVTVLALGFVIAKYGRFEIYTVKYSELYMQLEWDNYLIAEWIIPLH